MKHNIKPKKSLGQNFLVDDNISRKIISVLDCRENDTVLEIGPGTGALTRYLAAQPVNLVAVEIDKRAVEELTAKFPAHDYKNLRIVNSDFLTFPIQTIVNDSKKIKVIGNIPYYISADIFFRLFESAALVEKAVLMIQKEVAARLAAKPRTKDYGILTLALDIVGRAKVKFDVPPTCFFPQPRVTSSIIEITFNENPPEARVFTSYLSLIRSAFNQRRKTLRNALKSYIESKTGKNIDDFIATLEPDISKYFSMRAEELTKEDFLKLNSLINL